MLYILLYVFFLFFVVQEVCSTRVPSLDVIRWERAHGVVGYHARLANKICERCWVQFPMCPCIFCFLVRNTFKLHIQTLRNATNVRDVFQASLSAHVGVGHMGLNRVRGHALTSNFYLWGPFRRPPLYFNSISTSTFYKATAPPFHAVSL